MKKHQHYIGGKGKNRLEALRKASEVAEFQHTQFLNCAMCLAKSAQILKKKYVHQTWKITNPKISKITTPLTTLVPKRYGYFLTIHVLRCEIHQGGNDLPGPGVQKKKQGSVNLKEGD